MPPQLSGWSAAVSTWWPCRCPIITMSSPQLPSLWPPAIIIGLLIIKSEHPPFEREMTRSCAPPLDLLASSCPVIGPIIGSDVPCPLEQDELLSFSFDTGNQLDPPVRHFGSSLFFSFAVYATCEVRRSVTAPRFDILGNRVPPYPPHLTPDT